MSLGVFGTDASTLPGWHHKTQASAFTLTTEKQPAASFTELGVILGFAKQSPLPPTNSQSTVSIIFPLYLKNNLYSTPEATLPWPFVQLSLLLTMISPHLAGRQ